MSSNSQQQVDAQWSRLGSATISDALDRFNVAGQAFGILPVKSGLRLVGRAFTVRFVPITGRAGTVGDYVDDVPEGWVAALDNGGRTDVTVWGDILTQVAGARGLAGTVVHGATRDNREVMDSGYPLFHRAKLMRTGKDRVRVSEVNGEISLGYASVSQGDLIVGDDDGIVVVPSEREQEVLEASLEIDAAESGIRDAVADGMSLEEARGKFGYHRLQSRKK